jgi:AcrR family transcriptional regulator
MDMESELVLAEKKELHMLRTKQWLFQALTELMDEKGLEAITVQDLTKRAGLTTDTFYAHYRDKYDLFDHVKSTMSSGLKEVFHTFTPRPTQQSPIEESHSILTDIFTYLSKHAHFFRAMLGMKGDPGYITMFKQLMREHLIERFASERDEDHQKHIPKDVFIAYTLSAKLGVILYWLENEMPYPPQYMASTLTRIIHSGNLQSTV